MVAQESGPLYPRRDYADTELKFVKVKLLHSGITDHFKRILLPDQMMSGAICGVQTTFIPNEKKGIEFSEQILGTAFFIAPGVAITAWHVFEDFLPETVNGTYDNTPMSNEFQLISPLRQGEALTWPIHSFSAGSTPRSDDPDGSDLTSIGCHLAGLQPAQKVHSCLTVADRFPAIGERLHTIGLKEPRRRGWNAPIMLQTYESVGRVIDVFPNGRGRMPSGPCFALSCGVTGGMSGAPVFDNNGFVVGILSTGTEDQDNGYSIVSSIGPVLDHRVTHSWRPGEMINTSVRDLLAQDF